MKLKTAFAIVTAASTLALACSDDDDTTQNANNATNNNSNNKTNNSNNNSNNTNQTCPEVPCDTGVCDEASGNCVTCLGGTNGSGCTDPQLCLVDATSSTNNACVDCLDNTTCTEVTASTCTDANECGACEENDDCTHLSDTPLCNSGTCVECLSNDDCTNNMLCDMTAGTCTITPASATACQPCQYDEQCVDNHLCVPLDFNNNPHGNYCLRRLGNDPCDQPYRVLLMDETSVGGETDTYCGIAESLTTCEAVLATGTDCTDSNDPNMSDVTKCMADGARCENIGNVWLCTYSCVVAADECAPNRTCGPGMAGGTNFCGG